MTSQVVKGYHESHDVPAVVSDKKFLGSAGVFYFLYYGILLIIHIKYE